MSRPRFLADEDLRGNILLAVRRLEAAVEITSVFEQGWASATDEEVLDFAWRERWLLVSHDVNTMKSFAERSWSRNSRPVSRAAAPFVQTRGRMSDLDLVGV